jgi:hypothetical protein
MRLTVRPGAITFSSPGTNSYLAFIASPLREFQNRL